MRSVVTLSLIFECLMCKWWKKCYRYQTCKGMIAWAGDSDVWLCCGCVSGDFTTSANNCQVCKCVLTGRQHLRKIEILCFDCDFFLEPPAKQLHHPVLFVRAWQGQNKQPVSGTLVDNNSRTLEVALIPPLYGQTQRNPLLWRTSLYPFYSFPTLPLCIFVNLNIALSSRNKLRERTFTEICL